MNIEEEMEMDLKIDREFQEKIPPLTEEEFKQLRENILEDGEVYEPIIVWNGVIVDGHNRYRVIKEHPEIPYRVKQMDFADRWAAIDWMCRKQLGRRNLTEAQQEYLMGKMKEARTKSVGAPMGNTNAQKQLGQNDPIEKKPEYGTAAAIGRELGVTTTAVKRAERFAKGVDAVRAVSPAAAEKILGGKAGVSKETIRDLPKKTDAEVAEVARAIEEDRPIKAKPFPSGKEKELPGIVPTICRDRNAPPVEYELDDLLEEIRCVNEQCIRNYQSIMRMHKGIIAKNAAEVATVMGELVKELEKIEEEM